MPAPPSAERKQVRLAIVGWRKYTDAEHFCKMIDLWIAENGEPEAIVSGGAAGVDELARRCAEAHGIRLIEHLPDYPKYGGQAAPLVRNQLIVDDSTHMIAFLSPKSRGTKHSIGLAQKAGLPIEIVSI